MMTDWWMKHSEFGGRSSDAVFLLHHCSVSRGPGLLVFASGTRVVSPPRVVVLFEISVASS